MQVCISLAWDAFANLKSILRSPKPKMNLKTRLFKAACVSTLWYGWEICILTEAFTEKLDIFARKCSRIMQGIKKSRDYFTNERVYQRVNQVLIREMIRKRQLKFTDHCIRMPTHEPINLFVLDESKVRPSFRPVAQTRTYRQQISSQLLPGKKALEATEILNMAVKKSSWNKHFVVS